MSPALPALDGLVPPLGFSLWWLVCAFLLLVLPAVTAMVVLIRRIPRSSPAFVPPPAPHPVSQGTALTAIDALERRWREAEISPRSAAQQLSAIVRQAASDRSGIDAERLTLSELRHVQRLRPLATVIDALYHYEFSGAPGTWEHQDAAPGLKPSNGTIRLRPGEEESDTERLARAFAQSREAVTRWT